MKEGIPNEVETNQGCRRYERSCTLFAPGATNYLPRCNVYLEMNNVKALADSSGYIELLKQNERLFDYLFILLY